MNLLHLQSLIEKSYSPIHAKKFSIDDITDDQFNILKNVSIQILKYFPPQPFSCGYMSAMWVEMARKEGIEAYLVAGMLDLHGIRVFDYDKKIETIDSLNKWNGHCWAIFNGTIGDASFFRTSYSDASPKWLKDLVTKTFGEKRGAILATQKKMGLMGLQYFPKYIFSDYQLDGFLNTAELIMRKYFKCENNTKC